MRARGTVAVAVSVAGFGGAAAWIALPSEAREAGAPDAPALRVVKITGAEICTNYSRPPGIWWSYRSGARAAGLIVRDGDLLLLGNKGEDDLPFPVPWREGDGTSLAFTMRDAVLYLRGEAVALALSKDGAGWSWLEKASREDLLGLRSLVSREDPDPARIPLLRKLAEARPEIGLFLEGEDPTRIARLISLFRPRRLIVPGAVLEEKFAQLRPALREVEWLGLGGRGCGSLAYLPRLARLRQLVLSEECIPSERPIPRCDALRSLSIVGGDMKDLSCLAELPHLRELSIWLGRSLEDIGGLAALSHLRVLSLAGCEKVTDLSVLEKLPGLVWLTFPQAIPQEGFAAVIRSHPRLRAVELLGCKEVHDLGPLKELPDLQALVLVETRAEIAKLRDLKGLRYLALDQEVFEKDPDGVARLEKALPGCLIVEARPICLGSGWILLLGPAVALAFVVSALRGKRAGA